MSFLAESVQVTAARLADDAAIIGAAALALEEAG
jgi:hypothetical protein